MPSRAPFALATLHGRALDGVLDLPDEPGARPAVIVAHGFKGFMEWGFYPYLAELLAARGFTVVRFNFSGAGMRPGDEVVTDLDAFRYATVSGDLADLTALVEAVLEGVVGSGRVDSERLGLFGHSRGGGTALLVAASALGRERVRSLVTWSAIARYDRLSPEENALWRSRGEIPVLVARTGQVLAVADEVLADLETHRQAFDLESAAARRRAPWLLVHAGDDQRVPLAEGRALAAAAAPPSELVVLERAGHTLGATHPFVGPTPDLIQALNATQTWFRRTL
ncbi:MAG: alpha/beta hydrolase family protein [Thermoanaerobaculia bacterium]